MNNKHSVSIALVSPSAVFTSGGEGQGRAGGRAREGDAEQKLQKAGTDRQTIHTGGREKRESE